MGETPGRGDVLSGARWQKSRRSGAQGNCVELAAAADGTIAIRNSRHPGSAPLIFTATEMAAFLASVKDGQFDDLVNRSCDAGTAPSATHHLETGLGPGTHGSGRVVPAQGDAQVLLDLGVAVPHLSPVAQKGLGHRSRAP